MIQALQTALADQLAYRYAVVKEDAVGRTLQKHLGKIPAPEEMRLQGRFAHIAQGIDSYDEFQWNGKPLFQMRLKWDKLKVSIEVTDL